MFNFLEKFKYAWCILVTMKAAEYKVLCGLLRNPELGMRALAEKLGMNYWTLYKAVSRMMSSGVIHEVAIPNFHILKRELLVAGYGHLTKRRMVNIRKMRDLNLGDEFTSDVFYGFAESYRGFVLGISENYTSVKKSVVSMDKLTGMGQSSEEDVSLALFPIKLVDIPIFFDYAPLLCGSQREHIGLPAPARTELNRREVMAMYELTREPLISTGELAKRIGTTPQTASKIRKRLYEEHLLIKRYIPDLKSLGYEVLVFAHWFTNPTAMEKVINMGSVELDISPIIFVAYDMLEGVALAPFKSLQESREIISFFEDFGEKTGVIAREPTILFLSLQEGMKIREHHYAPMVRALID